MFLWEGHFLSYVTGCDSVTRETVSEPSFTREQPARAGEGAGRLGAGLGGPCLDVMLKFCVALTAFTFRARGCLRP